MATHTRATKRPLITHGDLDQHWYHTAHPYGLDTLAIERLRSNNPEPPGRV